MDPLQVGTVDPERDLLAGEMELRSGEPGLALRTLLAAADTVHPQFNNFWHRHLRGVTRGPWPGALRHQLSDQRAAVYGRYMLHSGRLRGQGSRRPLRLVATSRRSSIRRLRNAVRRPGRCRHPATANYSDGIKAHYL